MNIIFISRLYPSQPYGADENVTVALHNWVKYWKKTDNVIVIRPVYIYLRELFSKKKTLRPYTLERDGVCIIVIPVFKIPRITYFYYPFFRYVEKYTKKIGFQPDVVVSHYEKSLQIGYVYSKKKRLPLVVGIHAALDLFTDDPGDFVRRCGPILTSARLIACRSVFLFKKISKWFPEYIYKCFLAFSGIDGHLIQSFKESVSRLNHWKTPGLLNPVSIVTVCSLIKRKHVAAILKALARLPEKISWKYTIIGDGEERESLELLSKNLGIWERVHFKGKLLHKEVIEVLKQTHVFVMISELESFGLVYLEAMATGNIVIGAMGEGIDGIIENEKNGFLVPAGKEEPLKNVFEKIILYSDLKDLETLLYQAHDTITHFTEEKVACKYLNKIKEIVAEET